MTQFLQTLLDGVSVGCLYALIALGYTMVYGILKFINFAHSDIFALGVWMSISIAAWLGIGAIGQPTPPFYMGLLVLVGAMLVCGAVGFTVERIAYRPLRSAPRINVLITAIGVSLFLQNVGQLRFMFGPYPKSIPTLLPDRVLNQTVLSRGALALGENGAAVLLPHDVTIAPDRDYTLEVAAPGGAMVKAPVVAPPGDYKAGTPLEVWPPLDATPGQTYRLIRAPHVPIRLSDAAVVGTAVVLMAALQYLIFGTKLGLGMRAVSFNPRTAGLMGVNVDRVISFTFVVGTMLAAAAGFLYGLKYGGQAKQTADSMWVMLGLKAFVAAVVGGIGNVRGAVLGGLLIGLIEFFGVAYLSSQYRDAYVFAILILVLLLRPEGVLGRATVEKV